MLFLGAVLEQLVSKVVKNLLHLQLKWHQKPQKEAKEALQKAKEAEAAAKAAMDNGMVKVEVTVKGPGPGREAAIRSLQVAGLEIVSIQDVTPVPHNGCRPPKRPRG